MESHASELMGARKRLEELSNNFDVRKMAARIEDENKEDYYILCGWMGEKDVEAFIKEAENDHKVLIVVEEEREKFFGDPPTKLKNPKIFKPFEMFIKMYGLPAHDEMDPTIFVALTYTFIFGACSGMWGRDCACSDRRDHLSDEEGEPGGDHLCGGTFLHLLRIYVRKRVWI